MTESMRFIEALTELRHLETVWRQRGLLPAHGATPSPESRTVHCADSCLRAVPFATVTGAVTRGDAACWWTQTGTE